MEIRLGIFSIGIGPVEMKDVDDQAVTRTGGRTARLSGNDPRSIAMSPEYGMRVPGETDSRTYLPSLEKDIGKAAIRVQRPQRIACIDGGRVHHLKLAMAIPRPAKTPEKFPG